MPDGQTLTARLYERGQAKDGRWLFDVGLVVWRNGPKREHAEPAEYRVWIPAEQARRVNGADYSQVKTTRRQPPAPKPWPRPRPADRWKVEVVRRQPATDFQWVTVHRADCSLGAGGEEIDDEQKARERMAAEGGRGCAACGTDMSLRTAPDADSGR
ncbi:DUF6233 domain-containing protein [Streptomyces violascens]|uniref:DUF6233 domain-containing protein n=1 Tax=Streptomyces violascens TaxID=67381 RepID=UPI0036A9F0C3